MTGAPASDVVTRAEPRRQAIETSVAPSGDMGYQKASKGVVVGMVEGMRLPEPRGLLSEALGRDLATSTALSAATLDRAEQLATLPAGVLTDDDLQLSLAICYELHYRGFDDVSEDWEWDPCLLRLRGALERRHLAALRALVGPVEVTAESIDRPPTGREPLSARPA